MFRALYEDLIDYRGHALYEQVLLPWVPRAREALSRLSAYREPVGPAAPGRASPESLWQLYALSRVNDYLLLAFQGGDGTEWTGPRVSCEQYADFFEAVGFAPFSCRPFSPFYHEVVGVAQSENPSDPVRQVGCDWPGLMYGGLMFGRAGVRVAAGCDLLVRELAERSTLYFTHRRLRRPTADLSMGWGSNSQWRTAFRRDYRHGGSFLYNVDGRTALAAGASETKDGDGLTFGQRVELCRHRCFVRTRKDDADPWPYDDRWQEPADPPSLVKAEWLQWNEGVVAKLARTIEGERAYDCLPLLADALEDAGCTDADILAHCREPGGVHVRGCWVIDLLLRKE